MPPLLPLLARHDVSQSMRGRQEADCDSDCELTHAHTQADMRREARVCLSLFPLLPLIQGGHPYKTLVGHQTGRE